jgi:hypothetical protein
MKKGSIFFNLILLSFIIMIIALSFNYDRKTGQVPALIGIITLVFAFLALISEVFPQFGQKFDLDMFHITNFSNKIDEPEIIARWSEAAGFVLLSVWLILFYLSVFLVGFIIPLPLFLFLFLKIYGEQTWLKSICFSLSSWVFIYALFVKVMKFDLFRGVLRGDFL